MSIPYWILGVIYLLGLVFAALFFLFNLYHLRRFGFFDFTGFVITILCGGVITIVIVFSIIFLSQTNWSSDADLFDSTPFKGVTDQL